MLFKFIKKLSPRTQKIIGTILIILIITVVASMLLGIVFGFIGKLGKLSLMISLARFCFLIFLITVGMLIPAMLIISISLFIDTIKRDGFKKLFNRFLKTFTPAFIIVIIFYLIKDKNFELAKSIFYSLMITFLLFIKTEVDIFTEEETGQLPNNEVYSKISFYTALDFNKEPNTPILSITDNGKLKKILTILNKSQKITGMFNDLISPNYILDIYTYNNSIETVYLWMLNDGEISTYGYKDNSESIYGVSKTDTKKLKKILFENF